MSQEDNNTQDVEKKVGEMEVDSPGGDDFQDIFDAAVDSAAHETDGKPSEAEPKKPDTDADGNELQLYGQQKVAEPDGVEAKSEGEGTQDLAKAEEQPATPDPLEVLRAENAELMKRLETLEAANQARAAATEQKPEEEQLPEELQALYEDFPTLRTAVQYEAERIAKKAGVGAVDPELQHRLDVMDFNNSVCFGFVDGEGKFVDGVPDAIKITSDKEYWDWYGKKGYKPGSPVDAIRILNEYKSEKLGAASREHSAKSQERADAVKEAMGETIESGNQRRGNGAAGSSRKAMDFDGAFDEAIGQ